MMAKVNRTWLSGIQARRRCALNLLVERARVGSAKPARHGVTDGPAGELFYVILVRKVEPRA
jgi:hypothetical protein